MDKKSGSLNLPRLNPLTPIQRFINTESFGGILLFSVTIIALLMANSPFSAFYESLWQFEIGIQSESFKLIKPVILWINDGLMAIFFFLIGLEIKREILIGELNTIKKASLPVFAAIGGMIIPLGLFLFLNDNPETAKGWGIPMATDIAFTLAILKLLGKRIPLGLKVFLTAFAIIDDIGAVLVIAVFYSGEIAWNLLFYAGILLSVLYVLSILKVHNRYLMLFFGVAVWILFLKAGIHPTIAGILLAFAVPIRQKIDEFMFSDKLNRIVNRLTVSSATNDKPILTSEQIEEIDNLEEWTEKVQSPLQQLEHRLHAWVAYFIMPVFAFANAGIAFNQEINSDASLAFNIFISLLVGKMIGVTIFSYLGVKSKLAELPEKVNFRHVTGVALLSGVGFTMSLFISNLAFAGEADFLNSAKTGILLASAAAGLLGYILLRFVKSVK